jgi:stage II sporulation protein D
VAGERLVRVALAADGAAVELSGTGAWSVSEAGEAAPILRAGSGERWRVRRDGGALTVLSAGAAPLASSAGPLVIRAADGSFVIANGKRYRGELVLARADTGIALVNRLGLEDYLRGVVPLEIGRRTGDERAAVEAQAVAARSYTVVRLGGTARTMFDVRASVLDQVYGGVDAEYPLANDAVDATRGLVLTYAGRVVSAPYSSTCGGSTAAASEVWRSPDEPYLRAVSDRIPGTDRYYCDVSPSFTWTRTFERPELARALERYLASYVAVPAGGPGAVRDVRAAGRTPSGRVRAVVLTTTRRRYELRGNDVRFVLRAPGGEILRSTYFSLHASRGRDGRLSRLVLRGRGNGHGVGMCQWGAIGRARAGQDFRTILQTYYPGTSVDALQR